MRTVCASVTSILLLTSPLVAQSPPDLSGRWRLIETDSDRQAPGLGQEFVVAGNDEGLRLTVTRRQARGLDGVQPTEDRPGTAPRSVTVATPEDQRWIVTTWTEVKAAIRRPQGGVNAVRRDTSVLTLADDGTLRVSSEWLLMDAASRVISTRTRTTAVYKRIGG